MIPTGMTGSPVWHCAVDAWLDRQQAQGMLERHDTTARLTTLGILFVEALIRDLGQALGDVPII